MTECIFCSIVEGDLPGRIVAEADDAIAFLDANPLAPGHTLVVPRAHHERLADLSREESRALFDLVYDLLPAVEAGVDAEGITVGVNDGTAAGQEVPHVHVHLVPRFSGDGGHHIHAVAGERPSLSDAELDGIADRIRG